MTDRAEEQFARAIVRDAGERYVASRRACVSAFVDHHFSLLGSLALHRSAIGWDLLRAPANLFLAGPALAVKLISRAAQQAGCRRIAAWLAGRRVLLETDVAREIEWLVATELLEIPCVRRDRTSYRDAIAEAILTDRRATERIAALATAGPEIRKRLVAAIENYVGSRTAAAEITTGLLAAGLGALAVKQATPGLATLSSALAGMIAQQAAIAAFPLGAGLGALWYDLFPVTAGPRLLVVTTAGVFVAGTILAAFSGIIADPVQRWLGLHQTRLMRLLDALEQSLCGETGEYSTLRDHYVARLVDIFDLVALALRVSHA
jgi:hypothetical protein